MKQIKAVIILWLSVCISLFIPLNMFWVVFAAVLSHLNYKIAIFRETVFVVLIIAIATLLVLFFSQYIPTHIILFSVIPFLIFMTGLIYFLFPFSNKQIKFCLFLLWFVCLLIICFPKLQSNLHDQFLATLSGALITIIVNLLIPNKLAKIFKQDMVKIIDLLRDYNFLLARYIKDRNNQPELEQKQIALIHFFSSKSYPEWIYASGLNPTFQVGFGSFLLNLEKIVDNIFCLRFFVLHLDKNTYNTEFRLFIHEVLENNNQLLTSLKKFFLDENYELAENNFTDDIKVLDENLSHVIPKQLELLDASPQYSYLTMLVTHLKDMRLSLLQLLTMLTHESKNTNSE